jgi:hypothetical protein
MLAVAGRLRSLHAPSWVEEYHRTEESSPPGATVKIVKASEFKVVEIRVLRSRVLRSRVLKSRVVHNRVVAFDPRG